MNDTVIGQKSLDLHTTSAVQFLPPGAFLVGAGKDKTFLIAEGDLTSKEKGTTARANGGKPKWSLLPNHLLEGVVRVLEYGATKYAAWNWTKGAKWSSSFDSTIRHLNQFFWMAEDNDPESGLAHLDHAICNLIFLRHYTKHYAEGDDRPREIF